MKFTIHHIDNQTSARSGEIVTDRGSIPTPVFMPIGTRGSVKAVNTAELNSIDSRIILGNTYHLYLKPGHELISKAGGLHLFMNWNGSLLTDSGGFQVFSLAKLNKINDDGVEFQSHIDGSRHMFTPESSMEIQQHLGADIIMAFDQCPPGQSDYQTVESAVERTTSWMKRCVSYLEKNKGIHAWEQNVFPIVQGNVYEELRQKSAEELIPFATCGMAIGGLAVGEDKSDMFDTVEQMDELLPKDQPRYLMGVGRPTDLVRAVKRGVDMFDCVLPTRNARNGQLFTSSGIVNIRNEKHKEDFTTVDEKCGCDLCKNHTRAYLRHLMNVNEILGHRLATMHNLTYYMELMKTIRDEIAAGSFDDWSHNYLKTMINYKGM
ncbi:MAG: tRNA guanosine(34) transglycosylase Tgt [Candidatus Marinimicrobia bacterium]|nr:tRNA guanosine(34) transglycosylase Tgt [Candidatus Neomarinimicrobiota bacterium]MDP7095366.1 tRNA guanosine(34) transglycosylase Tgt [Candidatus Neomarinimicrobiota bacterium]